MPVNKMKALEKFLNLIIVFMFCFAALIFIDCRDAQCFYWEEEKGKHFIVKYPSDKSASWAREILRQAEVYYEKIAAEIGYARYRNFWTWENRVIITIFPDQKTFIEMTGQPDWSRGGAAGHRELLNSRSIISYPQEGRFIEEILPHEISHLILWDFVGFNKRLPVWFEEGVAQLQEKDKIELANMAMKRLVATDEFIPFDVLFRIDIREETDPLKVTIFYLESFLIVDFLIKKYGSESFGRLCRNLRDGKKFEDALAAAYILKINSISDFEKKWLRYMKNF